MAGSLVLCVAAAAERKPALVGATRDEVLARLGEPRSQIAAGSREVLFFASQRVVLRNNRVVEVEDLPAEVAPAPGAANPEQASETAKAPGAVESPEEATPAANTSAVESTSATVAAKPDVPEVQIKSVRPPSRAVNAVPRATIQAAPAPAPSRSETAKAPAGRPAPAATPAASTETAAAAPPPVHIPPPPATVVTPAVSAPATARPDAVPPSAPKLAVESTPAAKAAPAQQPPAEAAAADTSQAAADSNGGGFKMGVGATIAAAVGFFVFLRWRRRDRQVLLEATRVSRSPFAPEPSLPTNSARFSVDLLNKLEWKRFEELVASYYNKTGVVAARSKGGPETPVHIKISWKGEQRPFAFVHCVAHPGELVGPNAIQSLCEVLAAEDIRRGYVVTSGKFSAPAREFAEEKHVTLLSGEVFLEKLNALPEPARAELIKDATIGDYTTPTCPRCDVKTVRAEGGWQCPQCGTAVRG